jgi:hypothetical protein
VLGQRKEIKASVCLVMCENCIAVGGMKNVLGFCMYRPKASET